MLNTLPDSHLCMLVKVAHEATQNEDACADVAEAIGIPAEALERFGSEQIDGLLTEAELGLDVEAYAE
ncbi:hypothetical protein RKE25_23235 (plasmid) [Dyella sp. BiH032]|uniref:hypothetical protein n=1 Tax=Dyella sp. BiH032 TaxID=3075430 RepID=UPI00289375E5|nr:hypothetical protein [Dyella sp. BiH032]WNL48530.1 hypothetical protein RKE25_23235 [Dyella sp. BiH032]